MALFPIPSPVDTAHQEREEIAIFPAIGNCKALFRKLLGAVTLILVELIFINVILDTLRQEILDGTILCHPLPDICRGDSQGRNLDTVDLVGILFLQVTQTPTQLFQG